MIHLSYRIKMWTEVSFILSQFTCLTDKGTDVHLAHRCTVATYLQRSKRVVLIVTVKYFHETKQTLKNQA